MKFLRNIWDYDTTCYIFTGVYNCHFYCYNEGYGIYRGFFANDDLTDPWDDHDD